MGEFRRKGNLSLPQKNLWPTATKICVGNYDGDIYHQARFYPNWSKGFRFCSCVISRPSAQWLGFLVLEKSYSRDACTDFDTKYVNQRGSAQGSVFWGSRNQNLTLRSPFSSKTAMFRTHFDGTIFSPENGFNIGRLESKRPLIIVVAK